MSVSGVEVKLQQSEARFSSKKTVKLKKTDRAKEYQQEREWSCINALKRLQSQETFGECRRVISTSRRIAALKSASSPAKHNKRFFKEASCVASSWTVDGWTRR